MISVGGRHSDRLRENDRLLTMQNNGRELLSIRADGRVELGGHTTTLEALAVRLTEPPPTTIPAAVLGVAGAALASRRTLSRRRLLGLPR